MQIFEVGNTIRFIAKTYNFNHEITDSDPVPTLTIQDSAGNDTLAATAMDRVVKGEYQYDWTSTKADRFIAIISGKISDKTSLRRFRFRVKETTLD